MRSTTDLESRTYFSTLDGALADFELPLGAVDKARAAVRTLDFEHAFIPDSREHVALERAGETTPVAYITRTMVALHPPGRPSDWVQIAEPESKETESAMIKKTANDNAALVATTAESAPTTAGKRTPMTARKIAQERRDRVLATCPSCFTNLPATGVCGYCA